MSKPSEPDLSLVQPPELPDGGVDDDLAVQERESFAKSDPEDDAAHLRKVKHAFLARELQQIDALLQARKDYAKRIFTLVVCWLIGVAALLVLSGFGWWGFHLDTPVLLGLIGGTTINVIGIFTIVANFIFPKNGQALVSMSKSLFGPPG